MTLEVFGRCPCDSSWISQSFKGSKHPAVDLGFLDKYGANLPVKAWKSGIVVATGTDSAGGVYVVLKHDDVDCTWISRYWHFVKGSVKVKKGQEVTQGQILGTRGKTGISTGVHLHFEVWKCPIGYKYSSKDTKYAVDPITVTYLFEDQVMLGSKQFKKKPTEKTVEEKLADLEVEFNKLKVELELKDKSLTATEIALKEALQRIEDVRKAIS